MDGYYAQFTLFSEIHAIGRSDVCRVRNNSRHDVREARPLSDELVELGVGSPAAKRTDHPVRLVQVCTTPSTPRG